MNRLRVPYRLVFVVMGAILSAIGLELFLVPHGMFVGGVTGVSVLFAYFSEMRLGLFLFLLNLPFVIFRYRKLEPSVRLLTVAGMSILSLGAFVLHPAPPLIDSPLAASAIGGICLGLGLGMIIRCGGFLDAADGAVILAKPGNTERLGKALWLFNGIVLLLGGSLFGWDEAMYSIVAFLSAYQTATLAMNGFSVTRVVCITSSRCEEIARALGDEFGREATILQDGPDPDVGANRMLIFAHHRLERHKVLRIVRSMDPECALSIRTQS